MPLASLVLAIVTLQRLAELALSNRNTARLLARGGVERSSGHYPVIVFLHAAWLTLLWVVAASATVDLLWLLVFGVLQGLRVWVILTLGERWTTRIIVVPGEARVRRGPYRYVNHPNYLIVVAEFIALPMALGQPLIAIVFAALNAAVLWIRIRAEVLALDETEPHR